MCVCVCVSCREGCGASLGSTRLIGAVLLTRRDPLFVFVQGRSKALILKGARHTRGFDAASSWYRFNSSPACTTLNPSLKNSLLVFVLLILFLDPPGPKTFRRRNRRWGQSLA